MTLTPAQVQAITVIVAPPGLLITANGEVRP